MLGDWHGENKKITTTQSNGGRAMIGQIPHKELQKIGNYRDTFYNKEEERMMKIDARQLAEKEQAMEDKK